jgi:hypothetical protein
MEFSKKACQHNFFGCNAYNQGDQIGPIFIANWATFLFGQLFENYRASPKIWTTFFPRKKLCINFDKSGLGYILGDFFTNSSGHPGQ